MPGYWAKDRTVHQVFVGAVKGDAISDQVFMIRDWLRAAGATTTLYAERIDTSLVSEVKHYSALKPALGDTILFHYSIGSTLSAFVRSLPNRVIMMYHNITPPTFFTGASQELVELTQQGRRELGTFPNVVAALANSEYSRRDLVDAGYQHTAVLPLAYSTKRFDVESDPDVTVTYNDDRTNFLFVGRLAPNKRQEDVIKAFSYYQQINPHSRLFLVGSPFADSYRRWLEHFARRHRLKNVVFTGHVSDAALMGYYRLARVFVCLSDHEGFGVPLIEAMAQGIPVIAAATSAIPDTLGDAGILVHEKRFPVIAELMHLAAQDGTLRSRLIETGLIRAEQFHPDVVQRTFEGLIEPYLA